MMDFNRILIIKYYGYKFSFVELITRNIFTFKLRGGVMAIATLILMSSCTDDSEKKMIVCWG